MLEGEASLHENVMESSEPTSCNTLRGAKSWLNILLQQWSKHIVIQNPKAVHKRFLCTKNRFSSSMFTTWMSENYLAYQVS